MILSEVDKLRYIKGYNGLIDNWVVKSIVSFLATVWVSLTEIINVEPTLLLACFVALIIDLITGIFNSKRRGIPVTSFGLRQLFVKIIEAGLVIILFTVLAYAFGRLEGDSWVIAIFSTFKHIHYFAYFWLFYSEFLSILENLGGKDSRYGELWDVVKNKLFKHMDN